MTLELIEAFCKEDHSQTTRWIDDHLDTCPICHKGISPIRQIAFTSINSSNIEVVYRCPIKECDHLFISYYDNNSHYIKSEPQYPETPNIEKEILDISPKFYEIYKQALIAKTYQLNELVGMGLRKSLEILIKDFCIHENPNKDEEIKKMSLHNCIKDYCDANVRLCAHKSRILGNDETHYEKRYENTDVSDLEKLMKATLYWIGATLVRNSCNNK